jgi:hypothetical protein
MDEGSCDLFRGEVLCNILIEFGVPGKIVGLIKMRLNETTAQTLYVKICLTSFLFRMAWNKERLYHHCSSPLLWNKPLEGFKRTKNERNRIGHISFWAMLMT